MTTTLKDLAKMIDHSLLHPTLQDGELIAGCEVALHYDVASVCIKPFAVPLAVGILAGSDVKVGTVVGFPHGAIHVDIKKAETALVLAQGAVEVDMVVNIGKVLGNDWDYVAGEIRVINDLVTSQGGILKVIFENDFLLDDQSKVRLCKICNQCAVAFVKTSTGYGFVKGSDGNYAYRGATDHDLRLMRRECDPGVQVKAAGGIRTLDDLLRVRSLGVTRVGATATVSILDEARNRGYL